MYRDCLVSVCRVFGRFLLVQGFECAVRCCVCGLIVRFKVTLYELATPATAISQPRVSKQAQEKGCAESVEDRKKAGQSSAQDRRHGLLVQGFECAAKGHVCGLRVGLKVTLYELATPATAISQPRVSKQAQEKGCAESVEDRKKAV